MGPAADCLRAEVGADFRSAAARRADGVRRRRGRETALSLGAEKPGQIALRAAALPHLVVELRQRLAANQAHRHFVGQLLGLQEGMVREDPHVPELVRDRRGELSVVERVRRIRPRPSARTRRARVLDRLHRHQQTIRRRRSRREPRRRCRGARVARRRSVCTRCCCVRRSCATTLEALAQHTIAALATSTLRRGEDLRCISWTVRVIGRAFVGYFRLA